MNLWLNPHVAAATEVSDFDLAALRRRRVSLYLAVSPDNLVRVAPLYNLLFQQLLDLNLRAPCQARMSPWRCWCCWMSSPAWDPRRCWPTRSPMLRDMASGSCQ